MGSDSGSKKGRKSGSRILWEITVLVLIVFIISACLSWFFYRRSTDNVMENDKEKLIEVQAENMSTTFGFITEFLADLIAEKLGTTPEVMQKFINDVLSQKISPVQDEINTVMQRLVDSGALGMSEALAVIPATPPLFEEPLIIAASNPDRMYQSVPESILPVYETKDHYLYLEDGVPEWGLNSEYLIVYSEASYKEVGGQVFRPTGIKPMHSEMVAIDSYYDKQKRNVDLIMGIVIGVSLIILFIITFFALSYLIRRRITKPIDELSDVAEKVMEGDLDVQIPIKEGEEFEGLKRAFSAMLDSIRKVVSKAFDEE